MDSIDYAMKLCKEFGVDQSDAIKMLDFETDDMRDDHMHPGRKYRYADALNIAYDHLREWLAHGDEYVVQLEWEDLARFAASHRRVCVWAVLVCKSRVKQEAA